MRFLVDANLSPTVSGALRDGGFDATHVGEVDLLTASDVAISAFAVSVGAAVVSADSGRGHVRVRLLPIGSRHDQR